MPLGRAYWDAQFGIRRLSIASRNHNRTSVPNLVGEEHAVDVRRSANRLDMRFLGRITAFVHRHPTVTGTSPSLASSLLSWSAPRGRPGQCGEAAPDSAGSSTGCWPAVIAVPVRRRSRCAALPRTAEERFARSTTSCTRTRRHAGGYAPAARGGAQRRMGHAAGAAWRRASAHTPRRGAVLRLTRCSRPVGTDGPARGVGRSVEGVQAAGGQASAKKPARLMPPQVREPSSRARRPHRGAATCCSPT